MNAKLLLIPLVLLATACSDEQEDLNAWMKDVQRKAEMNLKPPVAPEPVEPAQYDAPQRITPNEFNSYRMRPPTAPKVSPVGVAPDFKRPKELLETVPLEKLKFVGTIGTANSLSALVKMDGSEQVYTVKLGNYMGQDYGRIVKITPDDITLSEAVEDANGTWERRQTVLVLGEVYQPADKDKK